MSINEMVISLPIIINDWGPRKPTEPSVWNPLENKILKVNVDDLVWEKLESVDISIIFKDCYGCFKSLFQEYGNYGFKLCITLAIKVALVLVASSIMEIDFVTASEI